ncbi:hypothetical protein EV421DRAFT_1739693 [Armillaria borealis]|uniref:DUF6699 domain-containing protein n=1 Tax=Armillaria borealis TaxID=47425 RepID=A0AA39J4Y5_9AGAR|nr:hypothetical protein EV421DRAFT_1739693 [Armillaria borealis]
MNNGGVTKTMHVRRENVTTMTTQRDSKPTELHLSTTTALYTPSRVSLVIRIPIYGEAQLTTTVSGYVNEAATNPPLPSLAIVHPKLQWPVVIQRPGDRERVMVADVVERLHMASSSLLLLENRNDAPSDSYQRMWDCEEQEVVQRLAYLRGKTA